jgi:hypothetical protein
MDTRMEEQEAMTMVIHMEEQEAATHMVEEHRPTSTMRSYSLSFCSSTSDPRSCRVCSTTTTTREQCCQQVQQQYL